MRRLIVGASITAFALSCSPVKPTDFKSSTREGIMADAKSSVPTKSQITYANGVVLLERRDGNIKIFFRDGDLLAEGKIIEREKDGSILFTSKESGNLMKLDPDGTVGFVPIETTTELKPRPNIR